MSEDLVTDLGKTRFLSIHGLTAAYLLAEYGLIQSELVAEHQMQFGL